MPSVTLVPNGLVSATRMVQYGGAASIVAALTDGSDATGVAWNGTGSGSGAEFTVDLSTVAMAAGSLVQQITLITRMFANVQNGTGNLYLRTGGTVVGSSVVSPYVTYGDTVDHTFTSVFTVSLNQSQLDGLQFQTYQVSWGIGVAAMQLDIVYAEAPTTSAVTVSGVITTTRTPIVFWSFAKGADSPGEQATYQVKVFTVSQCSAGGFDPNSSTPFSDSGLRYDKFRYQYTLESPLPSDTYRAYVQTSQIYEDYQYSSWAGSNDFLVVFRTEAVSDGAWGGMSGTAIGNRVWQANPVVGAWGAMAGAATATFKTPIQAATAGFWGGMVAQFDSLVGNVPSMSAWTDVYVEFLVDVNELPVFVLENMLAERDYLGDYFDGDLVRGGWLVDDVSSVSDYRWADGVSGRNRSISIFADDYQRTKGIVKALLMEAFPITEAAKYTITSSNAIPGVPLKTFVEVGDVFPTEATIIAQDPTNAARLAGLGYTAAQAGTAWTTGQFFSVGIFKFSWKLGPPAWQAGPHA